MTITTNKNENTLFVALEGRLDTTTAPQLDTTVITEYDVTNIELDFSKLEYISSAGLRVLLMTHKKAAAKGGTLVITNVCPDITEVFEITGFSDILTVR